MSISTITTNQIWTSTTNGWGSSSTTKKISINKSFTKNQILQNKRHWGDVISDAGDINWEVDEATCIRITKNKDLFYSEIKEFIFQKYQNLIDSDVLREIINYQKIRLHDPNQTYPVKETFNHNIHEVVENDKILKKEIKDLFFNGKNFRSDVSNWARETLWFGRRVAKYKTVLI